MKDTIRKVAVTFLEGALAVWAASGFELDASFTPIIAGGVAAALSLVYNLVRGYQNGAAKAKATATATAEGVEQTDNGTKWEDTPDGLVDQTPIADIGGDE